jgi:hypothetical protein
MDLAESARAENRTPGAVDRRNLKRRGGANLPPAGWSELRFSSVALRVTTAGFVVAMGMPNEIPCRKRSPVGDAVTFLERNPRFEGEHQTTGLRGGAPTRSPNGGTREFLLPIRPESMLALGTGQEHDLTIDLEFTGFT